MLRITTAFALAMALCCPLALAASDDYVMGNYHGEFTSSNWANRGVRAQVVTIGERYRAVLFVSPAGGNEVRVEVKGRKKRPPRGEDKNSPEAKRAAVSAYSGEVDLGGALGGVYKVNGEITQETFTGTFNGAGGKHSFELKRVFLEPPTRGMAAPEGAVVLMDGKSLDAWDAETHWQVHGGGAARITHSNLISEQEFGDAEYHIEFMTPFMPGDEGQARGNSGVYIMGRYEVQVLDNFGWPTADNLCGGIYKKAVPQVNAVLPPLQWQTYDITFRAPRFDAKGEKIANAVITVVHNGIVIHDNVAMDGGTPGGVSDEEAPAGPLLFQDHGDEVSYRNVWVKPLG